MGMRIFFVLLCLVALQACNKSDEASEQAPVGELSANDLAFLMPLESNRNIPRQVVRVSDSEFGIISQGNFSRVLSAANRVGVFIDQNPRTGVQNPSNWLLVGFRYSPCVHFAGTTNPCKEQIRFVFQPTQREGNDLTFRDYSMHVVYEYNSGNEPQDSEILASFRALNLLSGGLNEDQPLQPHPVLSNSAFSETYFEFIKTSIFAKFVATQRPKVITFMGLGRNTNGSLNVGIWHFLAGEVGPSGNWEHQSLPIGGRENLVTLFFNENQTLTTNVARDQSIPFNLFNGNVNNPNTHTAIFNPVTTNDHNTDCASCHVTDNQIFRRSAVLQTNENSAFSNNFFSQIDRIGRTSEVLVDNRFRGGHSVPDEVVTRIFGYMNAEPVISQRMVNDNAFAVKAANTLAGIPLPERQCQSERERRQVSQCLLSGDIRDTLRSCMEDFCTSTADDDGGGIEFGD